MKFYPKSDGKLFLKFLISILGIGLLTLSCSQLKTKDRGENNSPEDSLEKEYSLKADRTELDKARQEVPAEKKLANDELAFILSLMKSGKEDPNRVRSRYQAAMRKVRNRFREDHKKRRQKFTDEQRSARKKFLDQLKNKREEFRSEKNSREENNDFYKEQDAKRKEFFANEKDKRKEFDAEMSDRSKDFNSYMREKQKEFDQILRDYRKNKQEEKRLKRQKEREERRRQRDQARAMRQGKGRASYPTTSPNHPSLKEFEEMQKVPSQPLSPEDK